MRVSEDARPGSGARLAGGEPKSLETGAGASGDADDDLPAHARRRRDVAIPWDDPSAPPANGRSSVDDDRPEGRQSPRNGSAPPVADTNGTNSDGAPEGGGALPEARGQWFVDAPDPDAVPPGPPAGIGDIAADLEAEVAELDEFDHFGGEPGDGLDDEAYEEAGYPDEAYEDGYVGDAPYENGEAVDGDYVAYVDDGAVDEGHPDGLADVEPVAEAEVEEPPLSPLEARLARRAAKLSYRGGRVEPVYDVSGPKVRLGVLWFLLAWAGFALGPLGVGAVFVTAATVASLQVAAHLMIEEDTNSRVTAAVITAAVGTSAIFDARVVGIAILVSVVVAFLVASQTIDSHMTVQVAGLTLRAALPLGIAVAALLYLHRIDAWVFMILFGVVSLYDAGNFLVGTGSRRIWVGPLAGLIGAFAVVFGAAGFEAPPLTEKTTWLLGGLTALAAPLGQIVGSFMLPRPDAKAPALRRLDTYLIAAPLMLALFLAIGGNRPLM